MDVWFFFIVSCMYVVMRVVFMAVYIICMLCSMYVMRFMRYEYSESDEQKQSSLFLMRYLLDVTTGLAQCTWFFMYQSVLTLLAFTWQFFPVMVFVAMCIVLHANISDVLRYFVHSYNFLLENNDYVSSMQRSVWLLKIAIEIVVPIWNFLVTLVVGSATEMFKVLAAGDTVKVAVFSIFRNLAYSVQGLSFGVQKWIEVNTQTCTFDNMMQNKDIVDACLTQSNRDLDMKVALDSVQNVFISVSVLINGVCPSANTIAMMVLYPLYDSNIMGAAQDALNFVISLCYTTWDITSLRCRVAMKREYSSSLCFVDIHPLFVYIERILRSIGKLFDNWLNWINLSMNKLILERSEFSDASCAWEGAGVMFNQSVDTFSRNMTRIVSVNTYMAAVSDGYSVVYYRKIGVSQKKLDVVTDFSPHVHVGYGLAPVEFSGSIAQSDLYGSVNTGILGCKCTDREDTVDITCSVALFPGTMNTTNNTMRINTEIPVRFEQVTSGMLLECRSLRISVQPVRFGKIMATLDGTGGPIDARLDCREDPSRCNEVDAIIYVMPLCMRAGSGEDDSKVRTECITDSKFQTCYPYCVGMHQKRAGNTPIVLYSERSIRNGRHMVNMQCSNDNVAVGDTGAVQTAYVDYSSTDYTRAASMDVPLSVQFQSEQLSCTSNFQYVSYRSESSSDTTTSLVERAFVGYGGAAHAPSSMLADLQPYVFAGDYVVTQRCGSGAELSSFECKWTSALLRVQSDVYGQYQLVEVLSNIPSVDTDDVLYEENVHSELRIPKNTMDVFGNLNAAVQTDKGFFYAINPDLHSISERLRCSSSLADAQGSFQVMSKQAYKKPRVFVARPETKCARDAPSVMRGGILVTACAPDMSQEVMFTGDHAFWEYQNFCDTSLEGGDINMFVEDISYYNEHNVVVVVRRGPLSEFYLEAGLNPNERDTTIERMSHSVYYFVNTETLEVQAWTPHLSPSSKALINAGLGVMCVSDDVMPPVGSLLASMWITVLEAASVVMNQYILNVFGIVESMSGQRGRCNGENLMHSVYERCQYPVFTFRSVYDRFLEIDALIVTCVSRAFMFVSNRVDIPFLVSKSAALPISVVGTQQLQVMLKSLSIAQGGISAVVTGATQAVMSSIYFAFYVYNEVFIQCIHKIILSKYRDNSPISIGNIVTFASNSLYESIDNGVMRDTILSPLERSCLMFSSVFGSPDSPITKFVLSSCLSATNSVGATITLVSTIHTVGTITECVCGVTSNAYGVTVKDVEAQCKEKMPAGLWMMYSDFLYQRANGRGRVAKDTCEQVVSSMRVALLNVPDTTVQYMYVALQESASVPAHIMTMFNIPGFSDVSCTDFSSNEVVSIIPRPMTAFKRCAYTPNCRQKCRQEIQWFYAEADRIKTYNKPSIEGNMLAFLPVWKPGIMGLNQDFEPIAVQDYGEKYGCTRWIVAVGRPLSLSADTQTRPWRMYFFCFRADDARVFLRDSVELPDTGRLVFQDEERGGYFAEGDNEVLVTKVTLVPYLRDLKGAVVLNILQPTKPDDDFQSFVGTRITEIFVTTANTITAREILSVDALSRDRMTLDCVNIVENIKDGTCIDIVRFKEFSIVDSSLLPISAFSSNTTTSTNTDYVLALRVRLRVKCSNEEILSEFTWSTQEMLLHRHMLRDALTCTSYIEPDEATARSSSVSTFLRRKFVTSVPGAFGVISPSPTVTDVAKVDFVSFLVPDSTPGGYIRYSVHQSIEIKLPLEYGQIFYKKWQYVGLKFTGSSAPGVWCRVLSCIRTKSTIMEDWITEYAIKSEDEPMLNRLHADKTAILREVFPAGAFEMKKSVGLSIPINVSYSPQCDYMSCQACSSLKLQKLCYAAQRCASVRCVGTTLNVNNPFCVVGSFFKEVSELTIDGYMSVWVVVVDAIVAYYRISVFDFKSANIQIESMSNYVVSKHCELKDVIAVGSALLPSIIAQIIAMVTTKTGADELLDFKLGSASSVQSNISPLKKLRAYEQMLATTDMIYSIALGWYHYTYVMWKFVLCFTASMNSLTGGRISFISNNIGDNHNIEKYCKQQEREPPHSSADATDDEILKTLVKSGAVGSFPDNVRILSPKHSLMNEVILQFGDYMFFVKYYKQINMYLLLNAFLDWFLGLLNGIAQIVVLFEDDNCVPRTVSQESVLQCVCGDAPYVVSEENRVQTAADWSFWCTGILKMVNSDGYEVYVYNSASFDELVRDLHQPGIEYLKCISTRNENECNSERERVFMSKYMHFYQHTAKVSPLAVLNQCRQNYAEKTWDSGIFAYFNDDIQQNVISVGSVSEAQMTALGQQIMANPLYTNSATLRCLQGGPLKNSIRACMQAFFDTETRVAGTDDFYRYEEGKDSAHPPDACKFLSANAFQTHSSVRKCHSDTTHRKCGAASAFSGTECSILMSTLADGYISRRDSLNTFKVERKFDYDSENANVISKYDSIKECALGFVNDFKKQVDSRTSRIELDIVTGEGDFVHQIVDCVMMGAHNKTELMPADTEGTLSNLLYSRHPTGESRELPLPCKETVLSDTKKNISVLQRTCGTPARVSIMAYIIHQIITSEHDGIKAQIIKMIHDKIDTISKELANTLNYGCNKTNPRTGAVTVGWDQCCNVPGACRPGESTFEPNLPGVDMFLDAKELEDVVVSEFLRDVQYMGLTNLEVWTRYQQVGTTSSLGKDYNSNMTLLKQEDIAYPVHGSLRRVQDTEYEFPILRKENPLNIMDQCHSIIRAKTFTMQAAEHTLQVHSDNEDERETVHKMLTVEAILNELREAGEWKPLLKGPNQQVSREKIVHMIRSYKNSDYALNLLHDERFVSLDSRFCPSPQRDFAEPDPLPIRINMDSLSELFKANAAIMDVMEEEVADFMLNMKGKTVLGFSDDSRNMGDINTICPCPSHATGPTAPGFCTIDSSLCSIQFALDSEEHGVLFNDCSQVGTLTITYDKGYIGVVRELLDDHSEFLLKQGMRCDTMRPSNLWGITTPHDGGEIDGLDLLARARSGVSLSNLVHVNDSYVSVVGEGNRTVVLRNRAGTSAHNVLCGDAHKNHSWVARTGFPVLSMLAESPAVVNCLRFILEVSWADILDTYAPLQDDSPVELEEMHAAANSSILLWEKRCRVKLRKLRQCHEQGAYNVSMLKYRSGMDSAYATPSPACPFILSDTINEDTAKSISILYTPCVVVYHNRWFDPHLCTFHRHGRDARNEITLGGLSTECEVFNPMNMLSAHKTSGTSIMPEISHDFVQQVIGLDGLGVRSAGLVGARVGADFLFPDNTTVHAQCFDSVPYWPQAWQAPFGEILDDNTRHVTGFSNYMALLHECDASGICTEEIVVLPDKLRDHNLTSSKFGTSGVCREHSFGMPLVHTNSHRLCTSQKEQDIFSSRITKWTANGDSVPIDFTCTPDSYHDSGGGMGRVFGDLSRILDAVTHDTATYKNLDAAMRGAPVDEALAAWYSACVRDFNAVVRLSEYEDMDMTTVLRDVCSSVNAYGIDGTDTVCSSNRECGNAHRVCGVRGKCEEISIQVENEMEDTIEFGMSGMGCKADAGVSGASAWGRLPGFLQQHGMCSHLNAITYDRWLEAMKLCSGRGKHNACKGIQCTMKVVASEDGLRDFNTYVCSRNESEWDWVRQSPHSWPIDPETDTDTRDFNIVQMLGDIVGTLWGSTDENVHAFELQPHPCDSDYMHSPDFGWCQLTPVQAPEYAHWMRASATSDNFTLYERDTRLTPKGYANKLRFMGLLGDEIFQPGAGADNAAVVQQCENFGVCQAEYFTFGGVPQTREITMISEKSLNERVDIRSGYDMIKCGPMGTEYIQTPSKGNCVLDPFVSKLHTNILRRGWCSHLMKNSTRSDFLRFFSLNITNIQQREEERYDTCRRATPYNECLLYTDTTVFIYSADDSLKIAKTWNKILVLYDKLEELATDKLVFTEHDLSGALHKCAATVQTQSGVPVRSGTTPVYNRMEGKTSGVYWCLSFGLYETPLFWWVKYATARLVYRRPDATMFGESIFFATKYHVIDAYQQRMIPATDFKVQYSSSETLGQLWSRLNTATLHNPQKLNDDVFHVLYRDVLLDMLDAGSEASHMLFQCPLNMNFSQHKHADEVGSDNACFENNVYNLFKNGVNNLSVWTPKHAGAEVSCHKSIITAYTEYMKENSDATEQRVVFYNSDSHDTQGPELINMRPLLVPLVGDTTPTYESIQQSAHILEQVLRDVISENMKELLPYPGAGSYSETPYQATQDIYKNGVPVTELDVTRMVQDETYGSDTFDAYVTKKVNAKMESILKKFNDELYQVNNENPLLSLSGTAGLTHTHIFNRGRMQSRIHEADKTSYRKGVKSTPKLTLYDAQGGVLSSIELCADKEGPGGGASTPDENDGMPCSFHDMHAEYKKLDAGECTETPNQACDPDIGQRKQVSVPINNEIADKNCNANEHKNFRTRENARPELFEDAEKNVYLASIYNRPKSRNRHRHALCYRADSLCINPDKRTDINKRIFGWNTAADVGYARFRGKNVREIFIPDMLDKSKAQTTPWHALNDVYIPKEAVQDEYNSVMGSNEYNCNISNIEYPSVLQLTAYSINHDQFSSSTPTFAHVMYNDRVLMSRANGRQLLFGHHKSRDGSTTSPAPAWSFCPADPSNDPTSRIHHFREVNFNVDDAAESFINGNYHTFDQNIMTHWNTAETENFGDKAYKFTDGTFSGKSQKRRNMRIRQTVFNTFLKWHSTSTTTINGYNTCANIPAGNDWQNEFVWDVFQLGMCYEQDVYELMNKNPWWHLSICETISSFMRRSISFLFLRTLGVRMFSRFKMADFIEPMAGFFEDDRDGVYGHQVRARSIPLPLEPTAFSQDDISKTNPYDKGSMDSYFDTLNMCDHCEKCGDQDKCERGDYITHTDKFIAAVNFRKEFIQTVRSKSNDEKWNINSMSTLFARIFYGNLRRKMSNIATTDDVDDMNVINKHDMVLAPCIANTVEAQDWQGPPTEIYPLRTYSFSGGYFSKLQDVTETTQEKTYIERIDARGYCRYGGSKEHYITKPTQWEVIERNPRKIHLVACHPDCEKSNPPPEADCNNCHPILIQTSGQTAATADGFNKWSHSTRGACSFSIGSTADPDNKRKLFCWRGNGDIDDDFEDNFNYVQEESGDNIWLPRFGTTTHPMLWQRTKKSMYDGRPVLVNSKMPDNKYKHSVGCGFYVHDNNGNGGVEPAKYGPLTKREIDKTFITKYAQQVTKSLKNILGDIKKVETIISKHLNESKSDFEVAAVGDKLVFYNKYSTMKTYNADMLQAFERFGDRTYKPCSVKHSTEEQGCRFENGPHTVYEEEQGTIMYQDIQDGCVATNIETSQTPHECNKKVREHLDDLSRFVDGVYKKSNGLKLPVVAQSVDASAQHMRVDTRVSWLGGVIPFYALRERSAATRDDDYMKYMLSETRCEDTYRRRSSKESACYKNTEGKPSFVNPWLGGTYSFLRSMNYKRTKAYEPPSLNPDASYSLNIKNISMGLDMCSKANAIDGGVASGPCAATTCLQFGYDINETGHLQNRTMCQYSDRINAQVKTELPSYMDMLYLNRLHQSFNLYNPFPPESLCDVKFTPTKHDTDECRHAQAPVGFTPAEVRGRAKPAPSLRRDLNPKLTESTALNYDVFRIRKLRYSSLWSNTITGAQRATAGYTVLQMSPEQLGPNSIRLRVAERERLVVSSMRLTNDAHNDKYDVNWLTDVHESVRRDIARIDASPLYPKVCNSTRCTSKHWVCPLVDISIFGGSREWGRLYPEITLLTPDPITMRIKYGDLDGAHPFVDVRPVHYSELLEHVHFGLHYVVPRSDMPQWIRTRMREGVLRTITAFLFRTIASVHVQRVSAQPLATKRMDWPHMNMTLRSGEYVHEQQRLPFDLSSHITRAFVNVQTRAPVEYVERWHSRQALREPYAGAGMPVSTLDPGGDCHRSPLAKMTRAELHEVLSHDACSVAHKNETHHTIQCWTRQASVNRTYIFPTTSVLNTDIQEMYTTHERYQACHSMPPDREEHYAYTRDPASGVVANKTVRAELSLSKRVRVSPLWSLVMRLAGAGSRHVLPATPQSLWSGTASRRTQNPLWHKSDEFKAEFAKWDENWVYQNTDPSCPEMSGAISHSMWAGSSTKADMCLAAVGVANGASSHCRQSLIKSFDICQLPGFHNFCFHVEDVRRQIRDLNADANAYTNEYETLYTPSVYIEEEARFTWDSVAGMYDYLQLTQGGVCTDIELKVDTARNNAYSGDGGCLGQSLMMWANDIVLFRNVLGTLVDFIMTVLEIVYNLIVLLLSVVIQSSKQAITAIEDELSRLFERLFVTGWPLLKSIFVFVWQFIQNSMFRAWFEIFEGICKAVQWVVSSFLAALIKIPLVDKLGGTELTKTIEDVNSWNCQLRLPIENTYMANPTRFTGSRCFLQTPKFNLPTGALGGFVTDYSCTATSFCAEDTTSTRDATLCVNCEGGYGKYACDLTTKTCVCGMVEYPSTHCIRNSECMFPESMCEVRSAIGMTSFGTQKCALSLGTSFCYKEHTASSAGVCTTFRTTAIESLRTCTPSENDLQWWPSSGMCLGIDRSIRMTPSTELLFGDTYATPCVNHIMVSNIVFCLRVINEQTSTSTLSIVIDAGAALTVRSRRLLDANPALRVQSLEYFLEMSFERVSDIQGDCARVLIQCTPDTTESACLYCARLWWFWNMTTLERDTDIMHVRGGFAYFVRNPTHLLHAVRTAPHAARVIFDDWMHEDTQTLGIVHSYIPVAAAGLELFYQILEDSAMHAPRRLRNSSITQPSTSAPRQPRTQRSQNATQHIGDTPETLAYAPQRHGRRLLQNAQDVYTQKRIFNFRPLDKLTEVVSAHRAALYDSLFRPSGASCILSSGVLVDNIIMNFAMRMELAGWRAKRICSKSEAETVTDTVLACPIIEAPIFRIVSNVRILIDYYMKMSRSECLSNMSKSCVQPSQHQFASVQSLFPRVYSPNNTARADTTVRAIAQSDDPVLNAIWTLTNSIFSAFSIDMANRTGVILDFFSVDALNDDEVYNRMADNNEFSLGSLVRDMMTCNLHSTITCERRQVSLIMAFVLNFIFISFVLFFLPVPSVFVFFMWTIGLTMGVTYTAYNFSPVCFPQIPVCLGSGLFEISSILLPKQMHVPYPLVNTDICTVDLIHRNSSVTNEPCLRKCGAHPVRVDSVLSLLVSLETAYTSGHAVVSRSFDSVYDKYFGGRLLERHIAHFEAVFSGDNQSLHDSVYVCMMINSYKLLAYFIFFAFIAQFSAFLATYIMGIFSILLYKASDLILNFYNTR